MTWEATPDKPPLISIGSAASEPVRFAREELCRYLRQILGTTALEDANDGPRIVLSVDADGGLSDEGFRWTVEGRTLRLTGGGDLGLVFGTYAFLREVCGCAFSGLGPDSEHVPRQSHIRVQRDSGPREPGLWYRGVQFSYIETPRLVAWHLDWMAKNGLNFVMYMLGPDETLEPRDLPVDPHTGEPLLEAGTRAPRMRQGWFDQHVRPEIQKRGLKHDMNHHNLCFWLPPGRYLEEHPEWFALVDGQRGKQFTQLCICTSNDDAVRTLIDNVLRYLESHPEVKIVGVIPEDGHGMCQCEKCCADDPDAREAFRDPATRDHRDAANEDRSIALRYGRLLNRVARSVGTRFPGVLVAGAAYVNLNWPPRGLVLEPNILIWVALYWRDGARPLSPDHTSAFNDFYVDLLRQWKGALPARGRLIVYEYYMGMNAQRSLPYPMSDVICRDWPALRALGVQGATVQCMTGVHQAYALNMLAFARCGWTDRVDHDAVLEDFLTGMFGAAAPALRPIYAGLLAAMDELGARAPDTPEQAPEGVPNAVLQPRGDNVAYFIARAGRDTIERALSDARAGARTERERRQIASLGRYLEYCVRAADIEQAVLDMRKCGREEHPETGEQLAERVVQEDIPALIEFVESTPMPGWVSPAHVARWQSLQESLRSYRPRDRS